MAWTESLLPYTIEEFITAGEAERIVSLIEHYKRANTDRLTAGVTQKTVHVSDTMSLEELVAMYEPNGRIEITAEDLPSEVIAIVERAYFTHIEDIRRAYPSAAWPYGFAYVEYGPGQYFTPHADGITTAQCAGFGVALSDDFRGGEFLIETCGSNRMWVAGGDGMSRLAPGADVSSEWFRKLPRTEWSMSPRRGVAVFYGSALVHSSRPVTAGRLRKILGFVSKG
jgi:2OG-Fe(II) oxygenase superfamily